VGITPELAIASLVFLLAGTSFWLSWRLVRLGGILREGQGAWALCAATFAFLLLPGACFAQREHIAVLTLLPFMAAVSARMNGANVPMTVAALAGLGAGVTMAIKPHFVLAVAPLVVLLMWRRRSITAALIVECWSAAAVVGAYAGAVVLVYPAFVSDALPLLQAVYIPVRSSAAELLTAPASLLSLVAGGLALFLARSQIMRSGALLPLVAALGFAAAMAIQGKGYLNHAYPFVALTVFALGLIPMERHGDRGERIFASALLIGLAGAGAFIFAQAQTYPELAQLVRRVAPPHPRMMVAGSNLSIGHPLNRWVGGRWVGRRGALWATGTAVELMDRSTPEQRAVLQHSIDQDRQIFLEDVERGQPDVILVPGEIGHQWIASNPDVRRAVADYHPAGSAEGVTVLLR